MRTFNSGLIVVAALLMPALAQKNTNPFAGRWDFNITTPQGTHASWLGVTDKGGNPEVWYQPPGGNVYQVKDVHVDGSHLTLTLSPATAGRPAMTWELEASGGKLTGVQKSGDITTELTGVRAPELKRSAPKAWTNPEPTELAATAGRKSFDLLGNRQELFEKMAKEWGLDCVFDSDFDKKIPIRFRMDDVDYRDALHGLEAATGSFIVPLSDKLFMVVQDTVQKRTAVEPTATVMVRVSEAVVQLDFQDILRAVQQSMGIEKVDRKS